MKRYEVYFSHDLNPDDGRLLDDFCFPWLNIQVPKTEFRAVWNHDRLGFCFDVTDTDIVLGEESDKDKAVLGSDRIELFFASSSDLVQPYFGAEMDPRGWVYDYTAKMHRQFDDSWSFSSLELSGTIREGGYSVEGSFSIEELKDLQCLVDDSMITGVYRAEFSHGQDDIVQNWISWIDPGGATPDFHVPGSFGVFDFVRE